MFNNKFHSCPINRLLPYRHRPGDAAGNTTGRVGDMNGYDRFRHAGLDPESSAFNGLLDTGLRRYDDKGVNGTAVNRFLYMG